MNARKPSLCSCPPAAFAIILMLLFNGCSESSQKPVMPGIEGDITTISLDSMSGKQGAPRMLWGLYQFVIDAGDDSVEIVPLRSSEMHLNVVSFLEPGGQPGLVQIVGGLNWNPGKTELTIRIQLTHPFSQLSNLSGFDVRGILISRTGIAGFSDYYLTTPGKDDLRILNADGYTRWWNPREFQGDNIFSYRDGALGMKDSTFNFQCNLNGYKYFSDSLSEDADIASQNLGNRGVFWAGSVNRRIYKIAVPNFPSSLIFNYAVDASWEPPTVKPPTSVNDFPKGANQPEPWAIKVTEVSNTLYYDTSIPQQGGELSLEIKIYDWQDPSPYPTGTVKKVVIEWPGLFNPTEATFVNDTGSYSIWNVAVEPKAGAFTSTEPVEYLIWVESSDGAGYGGKLPGSTPLIAANRFYAEVSDSIPPLGELMWVKRAGGDNITMGFAVTTLGDYSTAVTGYFRDTSIFGEGEVNETQLAGYDLDDIFVARYNPDGTLAWAKKAGGSKFDYGSDITSLSDNSTVVTGQIWDNAVFGEGETNETHLTSFGATDMFIAKYKPDGLLEWVKKAGGTSQDSGNGITTLSDNSVVVTGGFRETAVFGEGEINETYLVSAGWTDIFVARFEDDGTLKWAKRAGGTKSVWGASVTALSDDSFVVTGLLDGTVIFGPGETNVTQLVSAGAIDIFIARYNADGTLAWAKRAGGAEYNWSYAVTALTDKSVVITGGFMGTAVFGEGEPNETHLVPSGLQDVFIARYNPDGTLAWAKRAGGTGVTIGNAVTALADNSVVVTGTFSLEAIFGEGEPQETQFVSNGETDIFIARYNSNGTLAWAKMAGGSQTDAGRGITTLIDNTIVATGNFRSTVVFGEGEPNETVLDATTQNLFIARYTP